MKQLFLATAVALACGTALAQTPSTPTNPASPSRAVEQNAVPTSPKAAAAADSKADARKSANPGADGTMVKQTPVTGEVPAGSKTAANKGEMNADTRKAGDSSDMKMVMDTNGDGMISRKEYDAYHAGMWKGMKTNKGMVSQADMQTRLKQGLGGM